MNYDPNRPAGYPPPPQGYPPPHGGYDSPYAPPSRKGRGWLIALIVFAVLGGITYTLWSFRVFDPLIKKIGLVQLTSYEDDAAGNSVYTWRGYQDATAVIAGKRWAEPGRCQNNWVEFRTDGTALSSDGSPGTWELQRNKDFTVRDERTGNLLQFEADAGYVYDEVNGSFVLHRKNAPAGTRGTSMEYCGPAQ